MKTALLLLLLSVPGTATAGIHPLFPLLDPQERETTDPAAVDAGKTCGRCHDATYIRSHSSHHARKLEVDCFRCHVPGGPQVLTEEHLKDDLVRYQMAPPSNATCGSCHGLVHEEKKPLELPADFLRAAFPSPTAWTLRTGEIFAAQRISDSFLNLSDKADRSRPWDVHAARKLNCTSCHFAANNPKRAGLGEAMKKGNLKRDPRTLTTGEYIERPDHRLATAACTACHDPAAAHPDMPYRARHMEALACQACHVPDLVAPTARVIDATVVTAAGGPRLELRGAAATEGHPNTWYTKGYRPFLLHESGEDRFAPYNLVARWEWADSAGTPVPAETILAAWKDPEGAFHRDLVALFDSDGDGRIADHELLLDSRERTDVIARRLKGLGIDQPTIRGSLSARALRHGIVEGRWVGGQCDTCHGPSSRFNEEVLLAKTLPDGVAPIPDEGVDELLGDRTIEVVGGRLVLRGNAATSDHYILGVDRPWSDLVGFLLFALTLLGVTVHGLWRFVAARRRTGKGHHAPTRREYIYNAYERLWHWVMAFSVLLLLVSGLHIHYPGGLTLMSFATAVFMHNVMAAVMLVNAFLALFYHLSTNEIRQFIPEGAGLFRRLKTQTMYYLQGIFRGAAHPAGKSRERKLNPLQQLTYAGLLNVLFPLQIGTGVLLWLAGLAPAATEAIGGLAVLAPIHNLGSWLFLTFLVVHVYLTTTGHTVLSNIRAMVDGWDEIEVADTAEGAKS